ncbi:MAG TPA: fibronectin type III domain-containing protein, partial [Iamia sp.]|nr:fibronectin type III domain-containing protein [Iamia sp.]
MSTHPTTAPLSTLRRLALLALGLMVVLTGIGLGSSPASAIEPGAPKGLLAAGYEKFIRVYITPSIWEDPDAPITGYTVERAVQGQGVANKTWNVANVAPIVDTSAVIGTSYVYRARANSTDGPSAWSELAVAKRSVGVEEWDKFDTVGFVNRQYQDFLGRQPSNAERTNAVTNLDLGAWTSGSFINMLFFRAE